MIIVPGLARRGELTFVWGSYTPSIIEITIVVGSFAFVSMNVLLFAKLFPLTPLYDVKEGQILLKKKKIGRVEVPAVIREE